MLFTHRFTEGTLPVWAVYDPDAWLLGVAVGVRVESATEPDVITGYRLIPNVNQTEWLWLVGPNIRPVHERLARLMAVHDGTEESGLWVRTAAVWDTFQKRPIRNVTESGNLQLYPGLCMPAADCTLLPNTALSIADPGL